MGEFQHAIDEIDRYNRQDPNGREYDHALAVSEWVSKLRPDASEALRLAARAHHIGRWEIPRDTYPRNRSGYLKWRKTLQQFHADTTAEILARCGYDPELIDRVRSIILKQRIKSDAETQALEDALCLVFIERQLEDFKHQVDEDKLANILRKTWHKMSEQGRQTALELPLPEATRTFIQRSLG